MKRIFALAILGILLAGCVSPSEIRCHSICENNNGTYEDTTFGGSDFAPKCVCDFEGKTQIYVMDGSWSCKVEQ